MIRAFIAIPLPEENQLQLQETVRTLRKLNLEARFPDTESIHLTLKFLGNIDKSQVLSMAGALEDCCLAHRTFPVYLRGLGAFPHSANPRVLWMGVEAGQKLRKLRQNLENRLVDFGFEPDNKPFRPHLTVARVKGKRNFKELVRLLSSKRESFSAGSFEVDSVALYRSELKPSGAEYCVLHQASLSKEETSDGPD